MPLLVEDLSPHLTSDIISQCRSIGIHTVTEFVTQNTEELSQKTNIPYKDLVCIRHNLLANYGGFPQRADSLYAMLLETMHIISTGSKKIDSFLKGGIYTGEVTELHGSPGSGKTQFCLSVSANLIFNSENTVLYLDSNSNFSARRLEQILIGRCEEKLVATEKMTKVRVIKVQDIYHLFDVLDYINCELQNMDKEYFKHLKLIVIDSITNLLSPCFGGKYLDGPGFMGNIAYLFKRICTEAMISILVSNNTVQSQTCDIKAGLGASWKYVPSVSLCIKKLNESKLRKLTAIKSCRNGLHNETSFNITEAGISD